jgi:hypothetical protein
MEKLLSGKQHQGVWELGVSLSGLAFVASREVPRKRLGDCKAIFFMSVSTTWTRDDFVLTDTIG